MSIRTAILLRYATKTVEKLKARSGVGFEKCISLKIKTSLNYK